MSPVSCVSNLAKVRRSRSFPLNGALQRVNQKLLRSKVLVYADSPEHRRGHEFRVLDFVVVVCVKASENTTQVAFTQRVSSLEPQHGSEK